MTGLLLRRLGVPALVVDRRGHRRRAPAAHVVNARTFEICRAAGVDMDAIAAASRIRPRCRHDLWLTNLAR